MRLEAEFTTEPFVGEGDPPTHAVAAHDAAVAAGLACDFGPLGTSAEGDADAVLAALAPLVTAALEGGASRITLQVQRAEG
ncbi:MAG TPA: thiamine-binding protein [Segeticoccus sp.]|nr:thiamine-binding protein [Segeticoccus sp.]